MRRIYFAFLVCLLLPAACAKVYEEHYDSLSLTTDKYVMGASKDDCVFPVYFSGQWTASLQEEVSWATLSTFDNTGVRYVRLACDRNRGPVRMATINIKCENGESAVVQVEQSGLAGIDLAYDTDAVDAPAEKLQVRVGFTTTLTREYFEEKLPDMIPESARDWIVDIDVDMDSDTSAVYREGSLVFNLEKNTAGIEREAVLATAVVGSDGTKYGDSIKVAQSALAAYLNMPQTSSVRKTAASRYCEIENNLGFLADSVVLGVSYPGEQKDFISNAVFDGEGISFDITATDEDREALFTLKLDYGENIHLNSQMTLLQKVYLNPKEITVDEMLQKFVSGSTVSYPSSSDTDDYIVLYVVGGRNPNMEQNINISANHITTDENYRTVYMQDANQNPLHGFRIKFQSESENKLQHGQKVRVMLGDCYLTKEEDPDRHTMEGFVAKDIEVLGTATLTPAVRTVSSLSDNDIYTYCQLQDMEFTQKLGSFTNVREYDAIKNPLSAKQAETQPYSSSYNNYQAKDGAANLLYDKDNNGIYALINMACSWRRTQDETVPQGVGPVSGVIVHTRMPRWCGDMGRYSIRPLTRSDIEIAENEASSFRTIAEWKLTEGVDGSAGVAKYKWLGGYTVGTSKNSSTQLVQNKMLATGGEKMSDAVLYSENRMLQRSAATCRDYPVKPMSGYRGLDVTDFTGPTTYGISIGSVLSFYGNPAGWLCWDENNKYTGDGNGIVMEFSTEGISGSAAAVSFSIASGYLKEMTESSTTVTNIAHQSSTSFPVYWKVEYAVSDDGSTWGPYTDALNAATGVSGFEMKCAPWALDGESSYALNYLSTTKYPLSTQIDNSFGLVPYRYALPSSVFGHAKVRVRIVPTSDIIYSYSEDWSVSGVAKQLRATVTASQKVNVNDAILIEDAMIQYR